MRGSFQWRQRLWAWTGGTTRSTTPAKMALRSCGTTGSSASGETGRSSALIVSSRMPSALREWVATASALAQNRCEGSGRVACYNAVEILLQRGEQ